MAFCLSKSRAFFLHFTVLHFFLPLDPDTAVSRGHTFFYKNKKLSLEVLHFDIHLFASVFYVKLLTPTSVYWCIHRMVVVQTQESGH